MVRSAENEELNMYVSWWLIELMRYLADQFQLALHDEFNCQRAEIWDLISCLFCMIDLKVEISIYFNSYL